MLRKITAKDQSSVILLEDAVICNNVKKIREERLMNKSELARRAGVSPLTIGRIENGYPCRVETKRKIIKALGFKLSDRNMVFPEEGQFNSPSRFIP